MGDAADRVWADSMPEAYERWLGPALFQPFAADLARRVAAHRPQRVLELAAGTGILTRELLAAVDGAEITATDLNDPMVRFGSGLAPGAQWRQADALELPFDEGRFDVAVCQFGVMFFPDRVAAYAEARRVLGSGGSLVFNTWGAVEEHDFAAALNAGFEQVFPDDPPSFLCAIPHGYCDLDNVRRDLHDSGFTSVSVETITLVGRAASAGDIATGFCTGTPIRAAIEARGRDVPATVAAVADVMEARLGSGEVSARMVAHVFEAS
jgi:ubiquinone/menaquinone biosynthesis C-methylase UbiE